MQKLELLAPAKNAEIGIAAINSGADAVYIAANNFGAREAAGNSLHDIETLVKYAHQYNAKVFLAENTILYDDELEAAHRLAVDAYNIGCDALIVQDMALLEMDLPPIELFASTQMNNQTPQYVKFLQDVGFKRVILARELSLTQIAEIRKATAVDLETFVHGALCVSYSGQCYLSCALTGRSANRGSCAQPCRSAYDLMDKNGNIIARNKHLLSLKDFNLSAQIKNLAAAGISSFKIEGRLKDASYVKNITAFYRKKIDDFLDGNVEYKKASSGTTKLMFEPNPELSFSRGFTNYFIDGHRKKMASLDTPKAIGEAIGTITETSANYFEIETSKTLQNGDGICFFDKNNQLFGTKINRVEGKKIFPLSMKNIFAGAIVYRNYNHLFEKTIEQKTSIRTISATITFASNAEKIKLHAVDEDCNSVELNLPQTGDIAKNIELAKKNLISNLSKSGDGIFTFNVEINADEIYFYPVSEINAWRRKIADLLLAERKRNYCRKESKIQPNNISFGKQNLDYTANVSNALARNFYKRHGVQNIDEAFELSAPKGAPILMFNKYCIRYEMGMCAKGKGKADDLFLLNNGRKLRLTFDCEHCEMKILSN